MQTIPARYEADEVLAAILGPRITMMDARTPTSFPARSSEDHAAAIFPLRESLREILFDADGTWKSDDELRNVVSASRNYR